MNNYYVYTLAYPDGTVFYVGKGAGKRIDNHEVEAKRGGTSSKCEIIRQIWADGGQVVKTKVQENLEERAAYQFEMTLIQEYGRERLTNLTDGGDGGSSSGRKAVLHLSLDAAETLELLMKFECRMRHDATLTAEQIIEELVEARWETIATSFTSKSKSG